MSYAPKDTECQVCGEIFDLPETADSTCGDCEEALFTERTLEKVEALHG